MRGGRPSQTQGGTLTSGLARASRRFTDSDLCRSRRRVRWVPSPGKGRAEADQLSPGPWRKAGTGQLIGFVVRGRLGLRPVEVAQEPLGERQVARDLQLAPKEQRDLIGLPGEQLAEGHDVAG